MDADEALVAAGEILGGRAATNAPLGRRTTYRVGGPAAIAVELGSREDLDLVSRAVRETGIELLVVGKGSNLLVADSGFKGLVLFVGGGPPWGSLDFSRDTVVSGAGVSLPVLARRTAAAGRTGLEWAVGVPGSVGGAVRMNAGGHGSDIAGHLVEAEVFDLSAGKSDSRPPASLELGYRHSVLRADEIVVSATFRTERGDPSVSLAAIEEIVRWRRENQPGGQNAGSVFVNPAGDSAGRMVDVAGCRGLRLGTAEVSPRHANFIQADPSGSADDVYALIREVQRRVKDHLGVELVPEVRLVGAFGDG
ncbi:MAG TPA: UDP-N-acetylmuramate dehydrogenase [Acidimicrobiales bacterium]|nr:UDP-N-acetylmuramate dehydrogenase [Acidimicrobiales bacterium]